MPIEPRQAGEEIVCRCGAKLHAPTMLEIRALEPAAVPPVETVSSSWGWRHQLRLLGTLALLAGIFAGGWFYYTRPISDSDKIPPEVLQRSAHNLTPVQTWSEWQSVKQGLDSRIDQKFFGQADQVSHLAHHFRRFCVGRRRIDRRRLASPSTESLRMTFTFTFVKEAADYKAHDNCIHVRQARCCCAIPGCILEN